MDNEKNEAEPSGATAGWSEELVSVVTDYRIEWRQPSAKQDAIKRLLSSTGAGVGWLENDGNGPYAVIAVSRPRLANATLTDAEREAAAWCRDNITAMAHPSSAFAHIHAATLRGLLERLK